MTKEEKFEFLKSFLEVCGVWDEYYTNRIRITENPFNIDTVLEADDPAEWLYGAFPWVGTPEGYWYWRGLVGPIEKYYEHITAKK